MMTVIKNFTCRNRNFTIVKNEDNWYCAIEDKYITDDKLNCSLNGFQMFAKPELAECVLAVKNKVEMDYLISKGYSKSGAFCIVNDIHDIEMLKVIEEMFNK